MPPRRKQQYRHLPAFILLALAEEPIHGGAVLNVLSQRMPLFKPDSAAVYRTLQQLEDEAQVVSSFSWITTNRQLRGQDAAASRRHAHSRSNGHRGFHCGDRGLQGIPINRG